MIERLSLRWTVFVKTIGLAGSLLALSLGASSACGAPPQIAPEEIPETAEPPGETAETPAETAETPAPAEAAETPETAETPGETTAEVSADTSPAKQSAPEVPADGPAGDEASPDVQREVQPAGPCPPCPSPRPGCVGTGICGCGPWVCEDGAPRRL